MNGKASNLSQQMYPPQTIIPPTIQQQQSGKENTINHKRTGNSSASTPALPHKPFQPKVTATTFGDVIHTELQLEVDTADVPMRVPVRHTSSETLISTLQQQQQQ